MLKALRKETGITMKALGDIIGVAESTISQYESGKREPDYETLLKLAEYFDVTVDYLLRGKGQKEKPAGDGEPPTSTEEALRQYYLKKVGREPTLDELHELDSFADTYIKGMQK